MTSSQPRWDGLANIGSASEEVKARDKDVSDDFDSYSESSSSSSSSEEDEGIVRSYIRSVVYGGFDGTITTFAIVAGSQGSSAGVTAALVIGLATVIADALSQATADYLACYCDLYQHRAQKKEEISCIQDCPSGQFRALMTQYRGKGIASPDAQVMTSIIAQNAEVWADVMAIEKLGKLGEHESPLKSAIVTFIAFIFFGFSSLVPLIIGFFANSTNPWFFYSSVIVSMFMVFILGIMKGYSTGGPVWRSGLETLLVGAVAAAAAYLIGLLFSPLIEK